MGWHSPTSCGSAAAEHTIWSSTRRDEMPAASSAPSFKRNVATVRDITSLTSYWSLSRVVVGGVLDNGRSSRSPTQLATARVVQICILKMHSAASGNEYSDSSAKSGPYSLCHRDTVPAALRGRPPARGRTGRLFQSHRLRACLRQAGSRTLQRRLQKFAAASVAMCRMQSDAVHG